MGQQSTLFRSPFSDYYTLGISNYVKTLIIHEFDGLCLIKFQYTIQRFDYFAVFEFSSTTTLNFLSGMFEKNKSR